MQTSINGQIGSDALSVYYFSLAISSLIVPTFVVSRLGSKLTLIAAFGVHIIYMLANFLPQYYSLVPVSILAGIAASCMWHVSLFKSSHVFTRIHTVITLKKHLGKQCVHKSKCY